MKSITALNLLKKHGLVNKHWTLRSLKWYRRYLIWSGFPLDDLSTWEGTIRHIMKLQYMAGDMDLTEPITIPEVSFSIGGTVEIHVGRMGAGKSYEIAKIKGAMEANHDV